MMNKSFLVSLVLLSFFLCGGKLFAAASQWRLVIEPEKAALAPLGTMKFKALVMGANGQSRQPKRVSWRTDGGDIDRDGNFRAPNEVCTVVVMAMVDDLHAWVRVNVKPAKALPRQRKTRPAQKKKEIVIKKVVKKEAAKAAPEPKATTTVKPKATPVVTPKATSTLKAQTQQEQELLRRLAQQERRLVIQEKRLSQQERRIAQQERRLALQERRFAVQESRCALDEKSRALRKPRPKPVAKPAPKPVHKQSSRRKQSARRKPVDRNFVFQRQVMDVLAWRVSRVDKNVRKLEAIVRVEHPAAKELEVFALCSRRLVRSIRTIKVRPARTAKLTAQFEANNVRRLGVRLIDNKGDYLAATTRDFNR